MTTPHTWVKREQKMKTSSKKQIVLPANVFDALKVSAERHGGVGGGEFYTDESLKNPRGTPCCIFGHASACGGNEWHALAVAGIAAASTWAENAPDTYIAINDEAVAAINDRKGVKNPTTRVTFAEWCAELNVVREGDPTGYHSREASR